MKLNYRYSITPAIQAHLQTLEVNKRLLDLLPPKPNREKNLKRESLLKSSLFSAKIEGNRLNLSDIDSSHSNPQDREKLEVSNLYRAYSWLQRQLQISIDFDLIKKLHQLSMGGLSEDAGHFRTEQSAIFNQAGVAVYLTPPASEIKPLIDQLVSQLVTIHDPPTILSAYAHFVFEKIHPFIDGNGRVGRLLSAAILNHSGYSFRYLVSMEEEINTNIDVYYDLLNLQNNDISDFIEFILQCLVSQTEKVINTLSQPIEETPELSLLPRRREILYLIREHKFVSFNFLSRRFMVVPKSTLHHDLKKLIDHGYIYKSGSTRGTLYQVNA